MNNSAQQIKELEAMAQRMRLDALDMALSTGKGGAHLGGGLSCIEIMAALYGEVMRYDVKNPAWADRDRLYVSKNHCVLAHFPALAEAGYLPKEELAELTKNGGRMNGYPKNIEIGLEYSGGSLGMAISVAIGAALAAREDKRDSRIYVLMGDGELHEGSIWEAVMSAAHFKLDHLTAVIDRNHLCYDGDTEEVMALEDLGAKFAAFNWNVVKCNGHDIKALLEAFTPADTGKPTVIIADTVKGKGVSFIENQCEWHQHTLSQEQYEQAKSEVLKGAAV